MAPDSKHRKDPTDPHLKFMTRSRRLILVTRDHMNSVGRISAEIHEITRSILAEHEEFLRERSTLQTEDDSEVEDNNIQREVSFDVANNACEHHHTGPQSNLEQRVGKHVDTEKLPLRYPHIPKLKMPTQTKHRDVSERRNRIRHTPKLPLVAKIPNQDVKNPSARIYQNPQIPHLHHKPSPRVKHEPLDTHKTAPVSKTVPRLNLHKLRLGDKKEEHLPVITNKYAVRRKSAAERRVNRDTSFKTLPVLIKRPTPVYKAPTQIMQPPGYAPRLETRLPRFEEESVEPKVKDKEKTAVGDNTVTKDEGLPEIVVNNSFLGRQRTETVRKTSRPLHRPPTRERSVQNTQRVDLSLSGRTLNEVIIPGRKRPDTQETSRGVSRESGDRRKTLKRKETVILPKVNPRPLISPDYKGKHFHRPSYFITSPVPMSQLAPTASFESCMSLSPMPQIHQMTLTPRQTMLISGSPTNFLSTSRPGSLIRETPAQSTVTRLPKLVSTGGISSGH